ncbi:MAG TPA: hypothetical protein PLV75_01805 [Saprospiraceae bacterium]|nr:hypothetical protein [Saprospiraceae bacterium]HQW24661.1 hypothetical protein [Saprospiraceae bacterium]
MWGLTYCAQQTITSGTYPGFIFHFSLQSNPTNKHKHFTKHQAATYLPADRDVINAREREV